MEIYWFFDDFYTIAHFHAVKKCAWNRYFSLTQGAQCLRFVKMRQNGRYSEAVKEKMYKFQIYTFEILHIYTNLGCVMCNTDYHAAIFYF